MRNHGELAAFPIVLDTLQEQAVRNRGQHMQRGIFRHRSQRPGMRRHHDVVRFGHGGNLLHLRNAAGTPGVGLHHVHQVGFDQLAQAEDGGHAFTSGQRHIGVVTDAAVTVQVVGRYRVFDKQQLVRLERTRQLGRVAGRQPRRPVQVDHDVHLVAHRLAQGRYLAHRVGHATAFDRRDAARLEAQRHLGCIGVGIDTNLVAHLAAQQVPHRHAQYFSLDVPQGHVDAGHGASAHRAGHAMHHDGRHHALPQALDMCGVLADQDALEVLHRRLDHARPA